MATKTRDKPAAPARTRYEDDLYTWVQEQVALLRAGRLGEVDAENVAEELGDVGKSEYRSLSSSIAVLVQHLLKWDHQPSRRTRSCALSVREQRIEIELVLAESPGLKSRIGEAVEQGYRLACVRALKETGLDENTFPAACPYSFDEMMTMPVLLEPKTRKRRKR